MQQLIRQLERVRARARLLLLTMRTSAWLSGIIAVALLAGVADYLLRLPGWVRLGILIVGLGYALAHITLSLIRWARLRPTLTSLAIRLERMHPAASGHLASAVAFATEPQSHEREADSAIHHSLTQKAEEEATGLLSARQVARLIEPTATVRWLVALVLIVGVFGGLTAAAPASVATAFQRWTQPLGDARWPNRYEVTSLTERSVAPNDAPVRVAARITRGDRPELRTWVVYRFTRVTEDGGRTTTDWKRALMTRQSNASLAGLYQRQIEPRSDVRGVELYFEAGDDRTNRQEIELIQPPTLDELVARIEPPEYAQDLVAPQQRYLLQSPQPQVTLDALAGSRVSLRVSVAGSYQPFDAETGGEDALRQWARRTLVGLLPEDQQQAAEEMSLDYEAISKAPNDETGAGEDEPFTFRVAWTLHDSTRFNLSFADAYGQRYEDERRFRFQVRPDRPPQATMLEPAADRTVLPTARVALAAEARDDVAVAEARLVARRPESEAKLLNQDDAVQPRTALEHELDLSGWELSPGDELAVLAIARDNYRLGDERHEPVESTPRHLRIISEQKFEQQVRTELADLRQRAIRTRNTQQRLTEAPAEGATARQQRDLAERLKSMRRSTEDLQRRIERNRFEDAPIQQTLKETGELTEGAGQSADRAAEQLSRATEAEEQDNPQEKQEATEQARDRQKDVDQQLDRLVNLLDQGRDAYELQQKLVKLSKEQEALSKKTRETLPKTLGQSREQLSEEQKRELDETSGEQQELSEQAQQLMERMRSTASAISRQSERSADQATAEALKQAASTATEKELDRKMEEASEQVKQNRLSQAQQRQQQAEQALNRMLEQINRNEQIRQQILRRKLLELVDSIRRLRDQQQAQLDRLNAAQALNGLDQPLLQLRRNTQSVAEEARNAEQKIQPVAEPLEAAASHQGTAVKALRVDQPDKADVQTAEKDALKKLEEALELAEKLAAEAEEQMNQQERQKLVEAYEKIKARQQKLRGRTRELLDTEPDNRDRRWRADSREAGDSQADVRVNLSDLQDEVSQTIVYKSMHDQLDAWAAGASKRLRRGEADPSVVFDQQMILTTIDSLIEALQPDQPDEQFATGQGGGDGGGGGQQGGGQQGMIPPAAELKLLRARQSQVNQMTRQLADGGEQEAGGQGDPQRQQLNSLAQQQNQLAEMGDQLIQQMQRDGQGQGPGGMPQIPQPPDSESESQEPPQPEPEGSETTPDAQGEPESPESQPSPDPQESNP